MAAYEEERQTSFEQFMKEFIRTAPPRHFGKMMHGRFTGYKRSNQQGIFLARILVQSPGGKFWINGLLTKLTIKSKLLALKYYDQRGFQCIDIDLEHLEDFEEYNPRDGTYFKIENEILVLENGTENHPLEGSRNRDLTIFTPPKSLKETSQVSFELC